LLAGATGRSASLLAPSIAQRDAKDKCSPGDFVSSHTSSLTAEVN
jgi:hypothetical protein